MQCLNPYTTSANGQDLTVGCGSCHPCRIRKREEWAGRILLESLSHPTSWFITLTYSAEHLPPSNSVNKRDPQLFMKRLRKRYPTEKIRYFCVGEYGSRTGRPHYHFVLFGPLLEPSAAVDASWALGFTTCAALTPERARYVARYTTKKLTGPLSFTDGRSPEFATMSRRPGLGRNAALTIGRQLARTVGSGAAIPEYVSIGGKRIRLDAYTIRLIESELGYGEQRGEIKAFKAHQAAPGKRAAAAKAGGLDVSEALKAEDEARRASVDPL